MSKVMSKDGTPIACDQKGAGPAVILVGGALNSRSFGLMGPLVPLLELRFTVINYDRRGRGESGDTKPYAVEREIEDIEALIDAVGGSAFVYGNSSGRPWLLRRRARLVVRSRSWWRMKRRSSLMTRAHPSRRISQRA
jgi:pimeloyl-ACP methyl ester carboxylesterase